MVCSVSEKTRNSITNSEGKRDNNSIQKCKFNFIYRYFFYTKGKFSNIFFLYNSLIVKMVRYDTFSIYFVTIGEIERKNNKGEA